jgi:predicted Zn finger-like uncharacterized protein
MHLNCPSCDSRFVIDPAALGASGRKVRCGRCGHAWHAEPGAAEAAGQSPPPAPLQAPEPAAPDDTAPDDAAPEDTAPEDTAPEDTAPEDTAPEDAAPEDAGPDDTAPDDAAPDDTAPDNAGPEDTAPDDPMPKLAAFDETRQRSHAARPPPPPEDKRSSGAGGWLLFAAVVAILAAGVFFGRQQIMAWVPETAGLYAMVGLASADPASVLELELGNSERRLVDGEQTLFVAGRIVNPTGRPQDVPPLVATLTDSGGAELKRWTFSADVDALPPGGSAAFQTSTAEPPHQGELKLNLDFASVR